MTERNLKSQRHYVTLTTIDGVEFVSITLDDYPNTRKSADTLGDKTATHLMIPTPTGEVYVPTNRVASLMVVFHELEGKV